MVDLAGFCLGLLFVPDSNYYLEFPCQISRIHRKSAIFLRTTRFDARDGATIATYYHAPSISMRADASVHVFQTRQEVREFFQGVADKYYSEGLRDSRFVNLDVKPIGSKSVLATLEWQMLRDDGSIIRTWRQSYN